MKNLDKMAMIEIMKKEKFCAFNFKDINGNFAKDGENIATVEMQTTEGVWYVTSPYVFDSIKEKFNLGEMKQ